MLDKDADGSVLSGRSRRKCSFEKKNLRTFTIGTIVCEIERLAVLTQERKRFLASVLFAYAPEIINFFFFCLKFVFIESKNKSCAEAAQNLIH